MGDGYKCTTSRNLYSSVKHYLIPFFLHHEGVFNLPNSATDFEPLLSRNVKKHSHLILSVVFLNIPSSQTKLTSKRRVSLWYHLMLGGGLPTASQSSSSESPTLTFTVEKFDVVTLTHSLGRMYFGPETCVKKEFICRILFLYTDENKINMEIKFSEF